jgi:hypothetical protein
MRIGGQSAPFAVCASRTDVLEASVWKPPDRVFKTTRSGHLLQVLVWKQAIMEIRWSSATRHRFDKSPTGRQSAGVALIQTAIEQTATDDRLRAS